MNEYIFVIGYTGHMESDKGVLHIVDNEDDLKTVTGYYVDHKIIDETGARKHLRLCKKLAHVYSTVNLNYADPEIFTKKYTELELLHSATINEIAAGKEMEKSTY